MPEDPKPVETDPCKAILFSISPQDKALDDLGLGNDTLPLRHTLSNGSIWIGDWVNNNPDGHGNLVHSNGVIEDLGFRKGLPFGEGRIRYPDGRIEIFEWPLKGNVVSAREYRWPNGDVWYPSNLNKGDNLGWCRLKLADGSEYSGASKGPHIPWCSLVPSDYSALSIDEIQPVGDFKVVNSDGSGFELVKQYGQIPWIGSVRDIGFDCSKDYKFFDSASCPYTGYGEFRYPNGDIIKGDFRDGKINGHAIVSFPNGLTFEADFCDSMFLDHGALNIPKDMKTTRLPKSRDGHKERWRSQKDSSLPQVAGYTPLNSTRSRFVRLEYSDGSVYTGGMKEDLRDGFGVMTYPDGTKYVGKWEKDAYCYGKLSFPVSSVKLPFSSLLMWLLPTLPIFCRVVSYEGGFSNDNYSGGVLTYLNGGTENVPSIQDSRYSGSGGGVSSGICG